VSEKEKPTIVCLTPVKNEAWLLDRFLKSASLWADRIIVADQHSDDGSREIAQSFQKVILVDSEEPSEFDEYKMRKVLFDEARKILGRRVLIALDADEALTPNVLTSSQWRAAINAPPGTSFGAKWANIRPDLQQYWMPSHYIPIGYVDDGAEYRCGKIHAPRIPSSPGLPIQRLDDIALMHYQYIDWNRMESKHRWYKCWEKVNAPHRSAISIYRQYHHMYSIGPKDLKVIPSWWFENYERVGIDMTTITREKSYRWEAIVLDYLDRYGAAFFADVDIWDVKWEEIAWSQGYESPARFRDPRSRVVKALHNWLVSTQPYASNYLVRAIDIILETVF
jgi:glycosyltransferase involved in cell wall biosynthesis